MFAVIRGRARFPMLMIVRPWPFQLVSLSTVRLVQQTMIRGNALYKVFPECLYKDAGCQYKATGDARARLYGVRNRRL